MSESDSIEAARDPRGRIPRWLVLAGWRHPRVVLASWSALALLAVPGVLLLRVETSTNSVLDRSSPEWVFYQRSQARFGGDEILTVLLEGDAPLDPSLLDRVVRLSDELAAIPGVSRVDSLSTVPNVRSSPDGFLSLEPVLERRARLSEGVLRDLADRIRDDRIAPRILVSDDLRAFGINLVLDPGAESRYESILAAVTDAVGDEALLSGVPVFRVAADERTRGEILTFIPLTVVLVGALLFVVFRSFRAMWIPLSTTALGAWLVMGLMGAQNVPVTITTVTLPSVLLALGCAYCMHLLNAVAVADRERVEQALSEVALPVMLSGLTTAVGFVAMSFVRIDAIRDIGAYGALGVLIVVMSSLTAAPAVMRLRQPAAELPRLAGLLHGTLPPRLVSLARSRRRLLLGAWTAVALLMFGGLWTLRVETDVIVWFPESDPIRVAYEAIKKRLVGISPINVVIDGGDAHTVAEPDAIRAIARLSDYMEGLDEVGRALSIADPLQQMHAGFREDPAERLPNDPALIEQYLLLLETKSYTSDLISPDRSQASVILRVDDNGSESLLKVAKNAEKWWLQNGPPGYLAQSTGIMFEFARAQDEIAWGQVRGLGFALAAVAVVMLLVFRNVRLALVALVPNALPIGMMFGAMGLLGYPIDAATVILGSLALGIAVDDTIHVSEGFARRRLGGEAPEAALLNTLRQVLAPMVYASLAVTLGFGVLMVSGFAPIEHLGGITAGIMVICLLADVLLLPALLLWKGEPAARVAGKLT